MDDAEIQQTGSPYDIFNDPQNRFVADFIGSPSTNFFDCTVSSTDTGVQVEHDLFDLELSGERAAAFPSAEHEPVTLGIRPDFVEVGGDPTLLEADVSVIEPTG